MDKQFLNQCLDTEIYEPYRTAKGRLNLLDRIWVKYFSPESNSVLLIRKKEYYETRGGVYGVLARFLHVKLIRRYGIHITEGTQIDIGLRIAHPVAIVITKCRIGKNFQIYQNCTIGQKRRTGGSPIIGNNVTMYAGSKIIGKINVADNVILGASACLVSDANESGIYIGIPARKIEEKGV